MYKEITVKEALEMDNALLIDVRSEDEYFETTIPGAINIPVLNNEERAAVGTLYRQEGPERASRLGLSLVSSKLPEKVSRVDELAGRKKLTLFCWRGGQRSQVMASVLDSMGYSVYRVIGGYKAYRRYVNHYLDRDELPQRSVVLHGLTGVGKTEVLTQLGKMGLSVLDLEGLAQHRGSVYGKIGQLRSPSQKTFESSIVHFLTSIGDNGVFIVECESRCVGNLLVPPPLMNSIKNGYPLLLYTSLKNRVDRIREMYTEESAENIKELQSATASLEKKIGPARVTELNRMLEARNFEPVITYLLKSHYDPLYKYPAESSEKFNLSVDTSDIEKAARIIYDFVRNLPK